MTTLVVVNAGAGGGRAGRLLPDLRERIPALLACDLLETTEIATARTALAERLADSALRKIVSVGGDGSARLVVQALLDSGRQDVVLGLVPAGTGSDFARHLELCREPGEALRIALAAVSSRPIDAIEVAVGDPAIGECGGARTELARHLCLNIASVGISGAVDEAVETARQRGRSSYLGATLVALTRYRAPRVEIHLDGRRVHGGPLLLAAAANGRFFGQGMRVAPMADEADGLLDLVVVDPVAAWRLPLRLPAFLAGRHIGLPEVAVHRGRGIQIRSIDGDPLAFDLDGEPLRAASATIRVLPSALRLAA